MSTTFAHLESPLDPVLDPSIYVEPKDRGTDSEELRQARFVATMRREHPAFRVIAIPNGQRRSQWEKNKARREGLSPGEPDVSITWADAPTVRIEFKDARSMPEPHQVEVLNWYHLRGHPVAVCRTCEGAIGWLRSIGAPL